MAWCQYVGNALKDLICAPRPINVDDSGKNVVLLVLPTKEETELNAKVLIYSPPQCSMRYEVPEAEQYEAELW